MKQTTLSMSDYNLSSKQISQPCFPLQRLDRFITNAQTSFRVFFNFSGYPS